MEFERFFQRGFFKDLSIVLTFDAEVLLVRRIEYLNWEAAVAIRKL